MKKAISVLVLVALSGCTEMYDPVLASRPKDMAKYDLDRRACVTEAHARGQAAADNNTGKRMITGGFGLLGGLAVIAASDPNDDYVKSSLTMVDECLAQKGYDIIKTEHTPGL